MDKTTSRIAESEFAGLEMRLESVLGVVRRAHDVLKNTPDVDEIWAFRRWSLDNGLKALESFAEELRKSTIALASGQPLTAESTKTAPRTSKSEAAAEKKGPAKKRTGTRKKSG